MKRHLIAWMAFVLLAPTHTALAQTPTPAPTASPAPSTRCATAWKLDPIRTIIDDVLNNALTLTPSPANGSASPSEKLLHRLLSDMAIKKLYERAQKENMMTQLGATADASSVSSLVTKASTSLLGFSFEYETAKNPASSPAPTTTPTPPPGATPAASETTTPAVPDAFTGTLITFSGRPVDAIRQGLLKEPFMNGVVTSCDGPWMHFASKIAVAGTMQTSGDLNSTTTVNDSQTNLRTFSIRYEIRNSREPRGHYRATQLKEQAAFDLKNLPLEARAALATAAADPAIKSWLDGIAKVIENLPEGAESRAALLEQAREEIGKLRPDTLAGFQAAANVQAALDAHLRGASSGFMAETTKGTLLTAELNFDSTSVPNVDLYGLKFIYAKSMSTNVEFTANVSSQIGRKVVEAAQSGAAAPALQSTDTQGYFRDAQLAAQLDIRLGTAAKNIGALSASGKAQYLSDKVQAMESIPGVSTPGLEPGFVGYVQVKWSLPLNGVVITPFSITWASRSSLIKEAQIRGNVGISLNMDSLLAKLGQH